MSKWTPEICYEEGHAKDTLTQGIPFIQVPEEHSMPGVLFIYESRKIEDEELEKEIILHSYANMLQLKEKLSAQEYDKVRIALGLKPLAEALALGEEINKKINENLIVK